MCDCYSCILHYSIRKSQRTCRKVIKIVVFLTLNLFVKMASLVKSNVKDVISANNVDINKSTNKMLIPDHNILPLNIMQTKLCLS